MAAIGVDVGTHSVRVGLFAVADGRKLARAERPLTMEALGAGVREQHTAEIWKHVCAGVRDVVAAAPEGVEVIGIGFDATCSFVACDAGGSPVREVGLAGGDVILWLDHRATAEAEAITAGGHEVLGCLGGCMSPEMDPPRIVWLKKHNPDAYARVKHYFSLPDWLTFKATGNVLRSSCSTTCKMTYHRGWSADFWAQAGVPEIAEDGFSKLGGSQIAAVGSPVPGGLSARAAAEFGLQEGLAVGVSIIDAHAGGLGVLGAASVPLHETVAVIAGTSTCLMMPQEDETAVRGVWGPYEKAMVPDMHLLEGGLSASGALIEHVLGTHPAAAGVPADQLYERLESCLAAAAKRDGHGSAVAFLVRGLHCLPFHHGCRTPLADMTLGGMWIGETLATDLESLALRYLAALVSLCYVKRHILEDVCAARGTAVGKLQLCVGGGGMAASALFLQQLADVTGCEVVMPASKDAVVLGAAMLGAAAAGDALKTCMGRMSRAERSFAPTADSALRKLHDSRYSVYKLMIAQQRAVQAQMAN